MRIIHSLGTAAFAAAALGVGAARAQDVPAGYPSDYAAVIKAAKSEGTVSIYASTDSAQAKALLDAFSAKYPGIKIEYNDRGTNGAYDRVISEAAARQVGADIIEQPEIMLAHFSTAPAAAAVRDVIRAPVLTSPEAAVAKLRRLIVPS